MIPHPRQLWAPYSQRTPIDRWSYLLTSLLLINAIHTIQNQMLSVCFKRTILPSIEPSHFHMVINNASTSNDFDHRSTSSRPNSNRCATSALSQCWLPQANSTLLCARSTTFIAPVLRRQLSAGAGRRDRIKAEIRREDVKIHELS